MPPLATELFDYTLPPHLIAQTPAARRDHSRLLVVDRQSRTLQHRRFSDLPEYVGHQDCLIRNNAAVLPARLKAQRPTGGAVECLLLRPDTGDEVPEVWWCLVRPGRRLGVGATFEREGAFHATVLEKQPDGTTRVAFATAKGEPMSAVAQRIGEMPLPPYIARESTGSGQREFDVSRYQTVYADPARTVAVAAPTAGLHFTPELLGQLESAGVAFRDVTLHVGLGTFRPISTATVDEHAIHREWYELPPTTQAALLSGAYRRIAVGTTSVRSIEDFMQRAGAASASPHVAEAGLFIRPPHRFLGVDALITNFHQPRSTLLCLVAAFLTPEDTAGIAWLQEIYHEAIRQEYRFFSYGDAMLIL